MKRIIVLLLILLSTLLSAENEIGREKVEFKDKEFEHFIQKAFEKAMQQRTTIVIAHRLSTIENADMIVVMDKGRILEQGSHTELLAKRGAYFQLHQRNFEE